MLGYISRGISYSSFFAVSIIAIVEPCPFLAESCLVTLAAGSSALPTALILSLPTIWGVFFLLASVASLLGVLTRTWVGEYIGVIMMIFCVLALAATQIIYGALILGIMLIGLASLLTYRWYMVAIERKQAMRRFQAREAWLRYSRQGE